MAQPSLLDNRRHQPMFTILVWRLTKDPPVTTNRLQGVPELGWASSVRDETLSIGSQSSEETSSTAICR